MNEIQKRNQWRDYRKEYICDVCGLSFESDTEQDICPECENEEMKK